MKYPKRKESLRRICLLLCTVLTVLLTAGCKAGSQGSAPSESGKDVLQVQFLKAGKADAIILQCGGETMVIDCGEEDDGDKVLDYLEKKGVQRVDVLMITHFDKDHMGGAATVVKRIPVSRVLLPAYSGSGNVYDDLMAALKSASVATENVTQTQSFDLGNAEVTVEPPASYEVPDDGKDHDNDLSLITTVVFESKRLVFAADIEKKRIREWLDGGTAQPCDLLKVPHHGVYNKALKELFETLKPSCAVICDSSKNPADERTLQLLSECGAACLQTKDGDVTISCDGENLIY